MEPTESLLPLEWECLQLLDSGQPPSSAMSGEIARLVELQYAMPHVRSGFVITGAGREAVVRFRRQLEPPPSPAAQGLPDEEKQDSAS